MLPLGRVEYQRACYLRRADFAAFRVLPSRHSRRDVPVLLPPGARYALDRIGSASLDSIAAALIRQSRELDLLAVRLPARDRRHHLLRRLVHAVQLRSL